MNTSSPIALFDSGIGGLTLLKALQRAFPCESYVYLADTQNLPYGTKSEEQVNQLSLKNLERLKKYQPKAIIIACNTASAWAYETLKIKSPCPVFNVIEPAVSSALQMTRDKRIGVIATPSTIQSHAYLDLLLKMDSQLKIYSRSCPQLVPFIEQGHYTELQALKMIKVCIEPLIRYGIDTLILGCTHYPLLRPYFEKYSPELNIIDSAEGLISTLKKDATLKLNSNQKPNAHLWVTGDLEAFVTKATSLGIFFNEKTTLLKEGA